MAGMADTVLQPAVIGEQQQALTVHVQPACRAYAGLRQVGGQGGAAFRIRELGQDAVGLVEQDDGGHVAG